MCHLCMETPIIKYDKETEEKDEQKRVNMEQ